MVKNDVDDNGNVLERVKIWLEHLRVSSSRLMEKGRELW